MSRVPRPPPPSPPPEDDEEELEEDIDEEDMDEMDFGDPMEALGAFLATEDGETIATALVGLKDATEKISLSLEMQNKILVKILSALSAKPTQCCCKPCESGAPAAA
jgi:hypothetical protein